MLTKCLNFMKKNWILENFDLSRTLSECMLVIYNMSEIMYVVYSKSIANFEFPRVTYLRFSLFCGVILVLMSLTYAKSGHFECSVHF